jgi:hypothetical protein
VSDGQRARAASSVVYWFARRAEGEPAFDAGDCFHQGKREPDWEAGADAGAGAGAGAGAKPPEGVAAAVRLARHCERNCGQVWPPVVPADFASFHRAAHSLMTLWPEGATAFDAGAAGRNQGKREPD